MITIKKVNAPKIDCNAYVIIEGNNALVVDPNESEELDEILGEDNLTVDYIILTHEHFDHISGLERIRNMTKAPVIANEICSENIQSVKYNLSNIADILAYFKTGAVSEERTPTFVCNPCEITYDKEYELKWQEHVLKFKLAPGHSQGSTLIYLDEDIAFTGDYLLKDQEVLLRLKGGSKAEYEDFARPLLEQIPLGTHIYPGHGEIYDLDEESIENQKESK